MADFIFCTLGSNGLMGLMEQRSELAPWAATPDSGSGSQSCTLLTGKTWATQAMGQAVFRLTSKWSDMSVATV